MKRPHCLDTAELYKYTLYCIVYTLYSRSIPAANLLGIAEEEERRTIPGGSGYTGGPERVQVHPGFSSTHRKG